MLWVLIRSALVTTHNICFLEEIRKISNFWLKKKKKQIQKKQIWSYVYLSDYNAKILCKFQQCHLHSVQKRSIHGVSSLSRQKMDQQPSSCKRYIVDSQTPEKFFFIEGCIVHMLFTLYKISWNCIH